ncbi:MAG: MBOAT family protein [Lachnospiraceae bacterium]|nr:MBOAT family protein [Lachnospiraceae bacterium]
MVFSSLLFISVFLPVVLIFYWILPGILSRNILLLIASLCFYAYGEPVYVFLMIVTAVLNYIWARLIVRFPGGKRAILVIAVLQNLGVLAVFKYAGFLAGLWNGLGIVTVPVPEIALPIGISFFTFQALSYVIDVYRGDAKEERNVFRLVLYVSFFPQLIAGPIVKYHDVEKELRDRTLTLDGTLLGIRRFVIGLAKKVLIANYMGAIADTLFAASGSELNILAAWLGAIAYMLQIYFDFGGYSDMAIGLGWMFGFHFKENFRYPYIASSMKGFWRRWHISLSTWFREYLYIPLGGNRKGKLRTGINKVIVFACTGIWHGANLTFLFWGLYHGFFLLMEEWLPGWRAAFRTSGVSGKSSMEKTGEKQKEGFAWNMLRHIYVLLAVLIGFVFFRADTLAQGFFWVKTMFTGFTFDNASMRLVMSELTPLNLTALAAGILASMPVAQGLKEKRVCQIASWPLTLVLLVLCMLCLAGGTYNPFIYFRF